MVTINKIEYPTRFVHHKTAGEVEIGCYSLYRKITDILNMEHLSQKASKQSALMAQRATHIDEKLYAYIDDNILLSSTDSEFEKYINDNID